MRACVRACVRAGVHACVHVCVRGLEKRGGRGKGGRRGVYVCEWTEGVESGNQKKKIPHTVGKSTTDESGCDDRKHQLVHLFFFDRHSEK